MAYVTGDTMIIVRGATGATEEWSNTWCVNIGVGDVQDSVDAIHAFYLDLFNGAGFMYNLSASASSVRVVDLVSGDELPASWTALVGTASGNALPSECAIRVSLRSSAGTNGGPFLPAPYVDVCTLSGLLDAGSQTAIKDALETMWQALFDAESNLSLNSPADEVLNGVVSVRVGQVFDAMRSRRSDISENYAAAAPPS